MSNRRYDCPDHDDPQTSFDLALNQLENATLIVKVDGEEREYPLNEDEDDG